MDSQFFRAGAGAVIVNAGDVLAAERADVAGAWQLPQGGLEIGEGPLDAVYREVAEETSIDRGALRLICPYPGLLAYELPPEMRNVTTGRGQVHQWYYFAFHGDRDAIEVKTGREFDRWRWMQFDELLHLVVPFRLPVYSQLAQYLRDHVVSGSA